MNDVLFLYAWKPFKLFTYFEFHRHPQPAVRPQISHRWNFESICKIKHRCENIIEISQRISILLGLVSGQFDPGLVLQIKGAWAHRFMGQTLFLSKIISYLLAFFRVPFIIAFLNFTLILLSLVLMCCGVRDQPWDTQNNCTKIKQIVVWSFSNVTVTGICTYSDISCLYNK